MKFLFASIVTIFISPLFCQSSQPNPSQVQQVSIQDVIAMRQAGLSDDIVIAKIHSHNSPLDLSTEQLVELKREKVSDSVIKALIDPTARPDATVIVQPAGLPGVSLNRPSGATPSEGGSTAGDPNDPLTSHDSGIYLFTKDRDGKPKLLMLERAAYQGAKTGGVFTSAVTYGIAKMKVKAVIPGKRSSFRVSEEKPVFYFYFDSKSAALGSNTLFGSSVSNPNQFALLRLKVEKNTRTTEIGEFSAWGGSSGSNEKSMVAFKSERISSGLYKIEIVDPIKEGEYCFVAASPVTGAYGAGATTARDLFDFGADTR